MSSEGTYLTIATASEGVLKDQGSKFISYVFPVSNESEAKAHFVELKKEHLSAQQHCFAYLIGFDKEQLRFSEDEVEQTRTGGLAILEQIQHTDLTNLLIVTVRYSDETQMNSRALAAAFRRAAADALKNAKVIEKQIMYVLQITFNIDSLNPIMKILKDENLEHGEKEEVRDGGFYFQYRLKFSVCKKDVNRITGILNKIWKVRIEYLTSV